MSPTKLQLRPHLGLLLAGCVRLNLSEWSTYILTLLEVCLLAHDHNAYRCLPVLTTTYLNHRPRRRELCTCTLLYAHTYPSKSHPENVPATLNVSHGICGPVDQGTEVINPYFFRELRLTPYSHQIKSFAIGLKASSQGQNGQVKKGIAIDIETPLM